MSAPELTALIFAVLALGTALGALAAVIIATPSRAILRYEVARLRLETGETLVVRSTRPLTAEAVERIRCEIEAVVGLEQPVMVLDAHLSLEILEAPRA